MRLRIENSTIARNQSDDTTDGAAVYVVNAGALDLVNSVVALNTGASSPDISGAVTSHGHNLIGIADGVGGLLGSDLTGTSLSPLDPLLSALGDHGGSTLTDLPLSGSPLIDAGDDAYVTDSFDQRGYTRIVGTVDIGAVEVQGSLTNNVPGAQETDENTDLTFSAETDNAIWVATDEVATASVSVALTVSHGILTLSSTSGLAFDPGDSNGSASMTVTGSADDINQALEGLVYSPASNYTGSDTLHVDSDDLVSQTDSDTVAITVDNLGPKNLVPAGQTTQENADLTFSWLYGNTLSVKDIDAGANTIQVTLAATHGTVTLSETSGLSFTFTDANGTGAGSGTNDATMTFRGTVDDINAALESAVFTPSTNYVGSAAAVEITTNDLGNNGSSTPETDDDTIAITVYDGPVNNVPGAQETQTDVALVFSSGNGNAFSITDVGAGSNSIEFTLTSTHGTLALAGVSGLTGSGNGTSSMTYTGTVSAINTALATLTLTPDSAFYGSASVELLTDDLGNNASSLSLTDDDTIDVFVDYAPINSVPESQEIDEDTSLVFSSGNSNLISVAYADVGPSDPIQVTLTTANGTLTLSTTSGLTGSGNGTDSLTYSGTKAYINAALSSLTFAPDSNFNGLSYVDMTTDDLGHNASGNAAAVESLVFIAVDSINDAPTGANHTATTNEDTPYVFQLSDFGFSDPDDSPANNLLAVQITSLPSVGTLMNTGTSTAISSGDYVSAADIDSGNIAFIPATNANGTGYASFTFQVQDDGGTDDGGVDQDSTDRTMTINVSAINDAPINTVPGGPTIKQDGTKVFSSAFGNALSISDVDAGASSVQVALSVSDGTVTLSGTSGLTISSGSNGSGGVTFTGTIANINAALAAGLTYAPAAGFSGSDSLQIVTNDLGNSGSGGAQSDTDSIAITVNAVTPIFSDTFSGSGTANLESHTPDVGSGWTLSQTGNVTVQGGYMEETTLDGSHNIFATFDAGTSDGTVSCDITIPSSGTYAASVAGRMTSNGSQRWFFRVANDGPGSGITLDNSVVASTGMTFTPGTTYNIELVFFGTSITAYVNGTSVCNCTSSTYENNTYWGLPVYAGSGYTAVQYDNFLMEDGFNYAPGNTVPVSQTAGKNTNLVFSSTNGNAVSIADADAGDNPVQVTLTATHGTLTLPAISGLIFSTGDGTSDTTMTFVGTITNINLDLAGLIFAPANNYTGSASLEIDTNDEGNSGAGGARTDSDTVAINVSEYNQAPVDTVPSSQTVTQDGQLYFKSANSNLISLSDADAGSSSTVQCSLSVSHGTLTLATTSGLSFSFSDANGTAAGGGTGDMSMTFRGTIANINAALAVLKYEPNAGYTGSDTLTVGSNDLGNSGYGGAQTDSDTVGITVNAVTPIFYDTFTDTNGTPLQSHTPDTGSGWTLSQTGNLTIQGGGMTESTTDAANNILATFNAGTADGSVAADITTPSGTFASGIGGRMNSSGSQRIWFRVANDGYGTGIFIDNTFVAASSISFTSSTTYHVKLVFSGTSISAYVNGVLACSTTSSTYSTNTYWGILSYAGSSWNAVTVDEFKMW